MGRRFTELLGQPPIAYLTQRRLRLAADLLLESDATLPAIARRVGYGSPFALSAAFKREFGRSPRTTARTVADTMSAPAGQPPGDRFRRPGERST